MSFAPFILGMKSQYGSEFQHLAEWFALLFRTAMGVALHSACVGKLDCGLTAKRQKYIQDTAGEDGFVAKVFCMAGIQPSEGKASTACQTSSDT